jgi:hypothetical protein
VRDAFIENLRSEGEVGAAFAVARGDELLVDLWGGSTDETRSVAVPSDALLSLFSTSKARSAWGHHSLTLGTLTEELVRRVDGRTLGRFFAEEVAAPLALRADVFLGVPASQDHRQLEMIAPPPGGALVNDPPNPRASKASYENPVLDPQWPNRREWRAAGLPSARTSSASHPNDFPVPGTWALTTISSVTSCHSSTTGGSSLLNGIKTANLKNSRSSVSQQP